MKATPTSIPESTRPRVEIRLFQDGNGNWFASVENQHTAGRLFFATSTYTTAREAVAEAMAGVQLR